MIVALYARVSTSKQAEKDLSIPDQLSQMRAWCQASGHSVGAEYVFSILQRTGADQSEFRLVPRA